MIWRAPNGRKELQAMAAITRKEARAQVFHLLFETEFHTEASPEEIYALSQEDREFVEDAYIRRVYFGVREHLT